MEKYEKKSFVRVLLNVSAISNENDYLYYKVPLPTTMPAFLDGISKRLTCITKHEHILPGFECHVYGANLLVLMICHILM
jgi:hypothetical protein